ncbi:MAG: DUF3261 domain-containing protein [Puniceicoccales bacterium]|jgi:hypothetical protein|nr:DUF3261 domain-containing protein [Puniceicoccales bacterium]
MPRLKPALSAVLLALALPVLAAAGGCRSTTATHTADTTVFLAPKVSITLPPPVLAAPLTSEKLLTSTVISTAGGTVRKTTHTLHVVLEADGSRVVLAGISTLGVRIFKITYSATGIETEQHVKIEKAPPPAQLLADVMLCHWPLAVWQKQLPAGWTIEDIKSPPPAPESRIRSEVPAGGSIRVLRDPSRRIVEEVVFNAAGAPVRILHRLFGYDVRLDPLDD